MPLPAMNQGSIRNGSVSNSLKHTDSVAATLCINLAKISTALAYIIDCYTVPCRAFFRAYTALILGTLKRVSGTVPSRAFFRAYTALILGTLKRISGICTQIRNVLSARSIAAVLESNRYIAAAKLPAAQSDDALDFEACSSWHSLAYLQTNSSCRAVSIADLQRRWRTIIMAS